MYKPNVKQTPIVISDKTGVKPFKLGKIGKLAIGTTAFLTSLVLIDSCSPKVSEEDYLKNKAITNSTITAQQKTIDSLKKEVSGIRSLAQENYDDITKIYDQMEEINKLISSHAGRLKKLGFDTDKLAISIASTNPELALDGVKRRALEQFSYDVAVKAHNIFEEMLSSSNIETKITPKDIFNIFQDSFYAYFMNGNNIGKRLQIKFSGNAKEVRLITSLFEKLGWESIAPPGLHFNPYTGNPKEVNFNLVEKYDKASNAVIKYYAKNKRIPALEENIEENNATTKGN
ncbi:MAG: hypothetical protein ABIH83_02535 [Candidatus Micrarchaeota archaeon]